MSDEWTDEQERLDAEWARLHENEANLRSAMRNATSDSERVELKRRLDATQRAIGRMEAAATGQAPGSTVTEADQLGDEDISDFLDTLLSNEEDATTHPRGGRIGSVSLFLWILLGSAFALSSAYVLSTVLVERPELGYLTLWDGWILHLAIFSCAALAAYRAITDKRGRAAWWLVTAGIALFGSGSLVYTYRDQNLDPIPFPGWSDVLYLESTLALVVALGLVTHLPAERVSRASRLNGLVIGLAAASVAVALWFETILEQSGSTAAVLVGLAYPLFDLVFIVVALSGLSLARFRPSLSVTAFVAAAAMWAIGDVTFLRQIAADTYIPGTLVDATWSVGIFLFALACWLPHRWTSDTAVRETSVGIAVIPWIAAFAALGVIGWSIDHDVPSLGVWLAMASLIMVMVRIALTLNELRQANEEFSQAWLGEVTGFTERPQPAAKTAAPIATTNNAPPSAWLIGFGAIATTALVGVGVLLWQVASDRGQAIEAERSQTTPTPAAAAAEEAAVDTTAASADENAATIPDVTAAAGTELVGTALQGELDRILAFTPLVFDSGQEDLTANHNRILNNVAAVLLTKPGLPVTIVGYTDDSGSAETNLQVSEARAAAVRNYLVGQGVPEADLVIDGRGDAIASGTADQSGLERRVEFEVAAPGGPAAAAGPLQLGVVASSAGNDLAFTESMVNSLNILAAEREGSTVTVVDNTILPQDAAAALRDMAEQGYDLVIAHDPRLGATIPAIAIEYPDVTFAWGPTAQIPAQPNVFTYTIAAEQGGYVLGTIAANLTANSVVGVIGPIEAGDAQRYVAGFEAGVAAERPEVSLLVRYTGSFLDASLAAQAATEHIGAGADVLTGAGPVAAGAAQVAIESEATWLGNYVDQSTIDPANVAASQVYHWDVPLREILTDSSAGGSGRAVAGTLANGGITVALNPSYPLDPAVAAKANELIASIVDGSISPPAN